ncbi:MAG TPA: adenylate/guanylate cyclase domain-containing protein [Acidimicrobiales bacterium]|nr:adenylate/guanylate cyclase domain-containing protein [Acidimicrobiales bacterium]
MDLCGFTDFVDDHGDDGAVQELQTLRAAVREVAPLFGVRVEKWLGDGLMLVGVDSEPLVGAALAIEQRHSRTGRLELRGGIASGAVILLEGDDYVGRAVNLASRLCDIAGPGQLLAATDNLDLPEWVAADEHDPVVVKGMADEVALVALSPDRVVLRRQSRTRSAKALLTVVEGITRPVRKWSQATTFVREALPSPPIVGVSNGQGRDNRVGDDNPEVACKDGGRGP